MKSVQANNLAPLQGKTAIISGSSSGIGVAIARELSARGASVVLNYPWESLKGECDAVGQSLATPWLAVCADLSTLEGPKKLVAEAVARFGHIDILVNNAGWVPMAPLWEAEPESWEKAMSLNARGYFLLTKEVLPHLTPYKPSGAMSGALGGSRIICIGSASSRTPEPGQGVYAATKGAIDAMIRVWARELPPKYGCTVNGVGPGPILNQNFIDILGESYETVRQEVEQATPCEGAFGSVEDVAWAVAFLADERSRWINGEYIILSGGTYMS
ncbi:unnamed protein product [Clonostachys rosea f. rosea IK726]|jgi:NAD(P)-dependent dehydrogenase (short-subunit alcohol dehydrogenase family)|uniref:Uncharacterized protein n=1 Tax=Clonostachys rosea f. rosea IK726 TaxID=1349383 RepID=A0ACA9UL80_BIOOC|nr:unnamed protein product [Clonostachys rosea f. rosea IK726]